MLVIREKSCILRILSCYRQLDLLGKKSCLLVNLVNNYVVFASC